MKSRGENGSPAEADGHTCSHLPHRVQAEKASLSANEKRGAGADWSSSVPVSSLSGSPPAACAGRAAGPATTMLTGAASEWNNLLNGK